MPVLGCGAEMQRLMDVSDQDVATIEEVISERLALGVGRADAQRQAVAEALAQVAEERDLVMAAVREQLGAEPDAPSEVRASNRTIEVDGRQRPTTNSKGQPIHPTEEGVRNFWRWFGDSLVVSDEGRPLVVYHGTAGDFSSFDPNKLGSNTRVSDAKKGFFFAASGKAASEFTWSNGEMTGNVMPVYLSMQNISDVNLPGEWEPGKYDAAIDKAKRDGRDGVIVRGATTLGTPGDVFIAFNPEQIKSATGNTGAFSAESPDIRYSNRQVTPLNFYSALAEGVSGLNIKSAPAATWKEQIGGLAKRGVKPDEVEWSGINEWLDLQQGKITKEQVLAYLDANGVRVEEVVLADKPGFTAADQARLDELERNRDRTEEEDAEFQRLIDAENEANDSGASTPAMPKYDQYQLPGGTNYREVLLTLPEKPSQWEGGWTADKIRAKRSDFVEDMGFDAATVDRVIDAVEDADGAYDALRALDAKVGSGVYAAVDKSARDMLRGLVSGAKKKREQEKAQQYKSHHWDQPNVLAHIRLNDRVEEVTTPLTADEQRQVADYDKTLARLGELRTRMNALGKEVERVHGEGWQKLLTKYQPLVDSGDMTKEEMTSRIVAELPKEYPQSIEKAKLNDEFNALAKTIGSRPSPVKRTYRVLFVEEVQSDWGQEGKKKGFKSGSADMAAMVRQYDQLNAERRVVEKAIAEGDDAAQATRDAVQRNIDLDREMVALAARMDAQRSGLPPAPFVTNTDKWLTLALKRIMVMAAQEGYDRVAFINGEQSAARYDLSKQISRVSWTEGGRIGKGEGWLDAYDLAGKRVMSKTLPKTQLADHIGKEVADRLLRATPTKPPGEGERSYDLSGLDLKVGGEGMKAFYDTIVPNTLKPLLKKVGGGQLDEVTIDQGGLTSARIGAPDDAWPFVVYVGDREVNRVGTRDIAEEEVADLRARGKNARYVQRLSTETQQPGFTITPQMQETVSMGLPLFSMRRVESTPEFQAWQEDLPLQPPSGAGPGIYFGYHGTTHPGIARFKKQGNPDGFLGEGPYFTTSPEDASTNYAGIGPDLTSRIELWVERNVPEEPRDMRDVLTDYFDANEELMPEGWERWGPIDEPDDLRGVWEAHGDAALRFAAERALKGESDGLVMPVYVKFKNPADITGRRGSTTLTYVEELDEDGESLGEPAGTLLDFIDATREVMSDYGVDSGDLVGALWDHAGDGEVDMQDVFKMFGQHASEAYTDQGDLMSPGALFREVAERAGYDGIIMSANEHFGPRRGFGGAALPGMRGVQADTLHLVPFESTHIKSPWNNSFSKDKSDIRYSKRSGPATWEMPEDSRSERLIYEFVDGRVDLKRAQEAIEKHTGVKDPRFDARTAETLYPGRVANRTDVFLRNEAKPLLDFIAKHNLEMDEVSDYLLARHAPEANAQIAKVNDDLPDGGAGTNSKGVLMTTQAAQDHIKAIPAGKMVLLRKVASMVDDITKGTRDMLVAEGLEQQGMIDAWTGAYKHYVPLFKEEVDGAPHPVGKGFTVRGSASKRRTGGEGEVTNILAHVLMQREAVITRAEKNRVLVRLYGLALSNPNPDFWAAIHPAKSAQTIMAELTRLGVDPLSINEMRVAPSIRTVSETTGKVIERTNPFYKDMPGALTLRIGGEDRVLMLNQDDPRALRMATNLKGQDGLIKLDLANMLVGKVTRYLASISTQYNPSFGLVNFLRDAQGAALNLSTTPLAGKQATVLAGAAPAAVAIGRAESDPSFKSPWADLWRQFQADGGQTGYKEMFRDANERMRKIEKEIADAGSGLHPLKVAGMILRAVDGFNTVMENAVRLSAYKAALDSGLSRDDAALLARELTVDFNRKGRTGRELGPLYAFFNAAAQGTARMLRTLNGPAGRAILAAGFSVGVLQALALAAAGFDDDEIPDYVKARGLIIPIEWGPKAEGGRKYVVTPLALGFNAIPNAGRAITELALTDGKDAKKKLGVVLGELISAFNPLGGGIDIFTKEGAVRLLAPTVADPLVDLATGKNFAGNPIEKRYDEERDGRPGFQRPTENTQRTATGQVYLGISKAINRATGGSDFEQGLASPSAEKVRHLAQVAGGGLLRDIERLVNIAAPVDGQRDLKASGIPVAGRLYGETDPDQVTRARFSSNRDRLEQLESRLKLMKSAGAGEPIAALYEREKMSSLIDVSNKVQQRLNDLNKQAVRVVNDPEQIKAIDQARVANMRALNDAVLELEQSQAKSKPLGRRLRDAVTAP